jgi:GntR family transcriptional repressor for pyruvate dehydrogenase complex
VYKVIQPSRLYQQIVHQIEENVQKGSLKPGDQLPAERELAQQFGVSRTAVREAIKTLHEKGLVEALPGRGTFITDGPTRSMRQSLDRILKGDEAGGTAALAEIREILEPEIAALAAMRAGEQDLAAMLDAVRVMDTAQEDLEAFIEADLDFHLALAEAAANPLILSLIDSIVGLLREQRMQIFNTAGGPARGQAHHKRILEAVERHDAQGAREAMRLHLRQVREDSSKPAGIQETVS